MEGFLRLGHTGIQPTIRQKYLDLPLGALTRHVCIVGATGSGKSTTATVLALELNEAEVPLLILDRTGEYALCLSKIPGFHVCRPSENLTTAPLQRAPEVSLELQVEGWVSLIGHYMMASFGASMSPLQGRVLREVLLRYYRGTKDTLTISRLIEKLEQYENGVRKRGGWEESIEALISRLVPLTVDIVGKALDRPFTDFELNSLLSGSTIIDLSVLVDDSAKNLLSQLILKQVYEMVRRMEFTPDPRLVVILDEAQHLAPERDYLSIPEMCATELRKFGFSLVTVASRPSMISRNIMANSNTVISHLLTNEFDLKSVAGYFMGGTENHSNVERLRTLSTGRAMAQINYPSPVFSAVYVMGEEKHAARLGLSRLM